MRADRIDAVLALVRSSGGRATPARRAILGALFDHQEEHPTTDQLTAAVQRAHPDVAASTVYRFLDELTRLGVVRPVRTGDGPTAYHLAEESTHHHLRCSSCEAMVELPDRVLTDLRSTLLRTHGFAIDAGHLMLTGLCRVCREGHGAAAGHLPAHLHG